MKKVLEFSNKIMDLIGVLLVLSLVIFVMLQVFMRYVLSSSLSWTDEIACYNLAWITFFGATLSMRDNEHLDVSVLTDILPQKVQKALFVLGYIIVEIFLAIFFYSTFVLIRINGDQLSPAMGTPSWILYTIMIISSLLMLIFNGCHLVKTLTSIRKGEDI